MEKPENHPVKNIEDPGIRPLSDWKKTDPSGDFPSGISDDQPILKTTVGYFIVPYRNKKISDDFFTPYENPVRVEGIYQGKSYDNGPDSPIYSESGICMLFQDRLSDDSLAYRRGVSVRAMQELLSIQWIPSKPFTYCPKGYLSYRTLTFSDNEVHGGLPYTAARSDLSSWLSYYDKKTGILDVSSFGKTETEIGENFSNALGATCGSSCIYGLHEAGSDTPARRSSEFTYDNGFRPVGDFGFPENVPDLFSVSTESLCKKAGLESMARCYEHLLPGDFLVMTKEDRSDSHSMQVIAEPRIFYDEKNQIDFEKSYVFIQDQRAGGTSVKSKSGHRIYFSGRTVCPKTFSELFKTFFVPLTHEIYF